MSRGLPGGERAGDSIRVRGLRKQYGKRVAFTAFSMNVPCGARFGVLGPNGAGKSTLMGILAGFIRPSAGEVMVDGLKAGSPALRGRVGVLPDGSPFPEDVAVGTFLGCLAALQDLDAARVVD